jgi:hypothetical protein
MFGGGKKYHLRGEEREGENTIFEGRRGKYGFWTDIYV